MEGERIALLQLVQAGEQPGAGQSGMPGHHRMRGLAAHRQRTARDMAGRDLQDALVGAVVDRQAHLDAGDGHIAHHTRAGDVEHALVIPFLGIGHDPTVVLVLALA